MQDAAMFTDGKGYERHMGRWSRLVGQEFLDWLSLPKDLRWLDVGCGNGAFTEEIVARCEPSAVAAVDPSEGQLEFARTRDATATVNFAVADAQELPFDDASFDVAIMALVIAFLPDPQKAVAHMARVVRSGGSVAAYMWDFESGGSPLHPVIDAVKSLGLPPPLPPNPVASSASALERFWKDAGLESIELRQIRIPVAFSGFDDLWESSALPIGPLGRSIQTMSPQTREQIRTRTRDLLGAGADGPVVFEARANAVKGRVAP